jgi:CHAT domain-containing protein
MGQAQNRLVRTRPELSDSFAELQAICSRLAALSLRASGSQTNRDMLKQIEQLTDQKERVEIRLSHQSAGFRAHQSTAQLTTEQLQNVLPAGTVLIDFRQYKRYQWAVVGGKPRPDFQQHLMAFVIRPDHEIRQIDLGAVQPVAEAVRTWRGTLGADPTAKQAAAQLRRLLWDPLAGALADASTVLVSPDGVVAQFPFAVLPGRSSGRLLIQDVGLAVVPTPQYLPQLLARGGESAVPEDKALLLVGDIDFDAEPGASLPAEAAQSGLIRAAARDRSGRTHYARLPGTRREIVLVRELFQEALPNGSWKTLQGRDATEAAFRQSVERCDYALLATHGFFASPSVTSAAESPGDRAPERLFAIDADVVGFHPGLLSGLALAGANRGSPPAIEPGKLADDGIVTALELAGLDLSGVDLVVLSACETGLGQVADGEGVMGLQRAFHLAGARTTIASLWKVDDDATRALMVEFYRNLWEKKLGKLESLRQAQLTMLRQYDPKAGRLRGPGAVKPVDPQRLEEAKEPEARRREPLPPLYWAGFVLSGDWR